jgi:AGCS family alanine or glycine:cation symporter
MVILNTFFSYLEVIDTFFWSYIGFTLVVLSGIYFTVSSKFFQFKVLTQLRKTVTDLHLAAGKNPHGIHPLRLYFASVGGMVGLGNIVGVITALILGGPGGLFWLWMASIFGMLIKYAEIYLGIHFRVKNDRGGYDGGPMFYLKKAFNNKSIPIFVSILLCIYGVEVYQFLIITDTLTTTFSLNRVLVIIGLLAAVLYTALGGISRLANICTILMPAFMVTYVIMCLWVIGNHASEIPGVLGTVIHSAFNGHATLGGFAGSTFILAAQHGIARSVYSGDIGIGYDSTIQSETQIHQPAKQARMAIFALSTDVIVCTMSMLVVLVTGVWHTTEPLQASQFVATALGMHFPYIESFMAIFFFLAGFTTIIAYFAVGMKCARFLLPRWGNKLYLIYGISAFAVFSFFDQSKVILIMSLSGGLLMMFNLFGILKLRKEIRFE